MAAFVVKEKCVSCGACVVICPQKAISMKNGRAWVNAELCVSCLKCVWKCYTRAILAEAPAPPRQ